MKMELQIQSLDGIITKIDIPTTATVFDLKKRIAKAKSLPLAKIKILHKAVPLKNNKKKLSYYNINPKNKLIVYTQKPKQKDSKKKGSDKKRISSFPQFANDGNGICVVIRKNSNGEHEFEEYEINTDDEDYDEFDDEDAEDDDGKNDDIEDDTDEDEMEHDDDDVEEEDDYDDEEDNMGSSNSNSNSNSNGNRIVQMSLIDLVDDLLNNPLVYSRIFNQNQQDQQQRRRRQPNSDALPELASGDEDDDNNADPDEDVEEVEDDDDENDDDNDDNDDNDAAMNVVSVNANDQGNNYHGPGIRIRGVNGPELLVRFSEFGNELIQTIEHDANIYNQYVKTDNELSEEVQNDINEIVSITCCSFETAAQYYMAFDGNKEAAINAVLSEM